MESDLWKFVVSQPLGVACLVTFVVGLKFNWWVMWRHHESMVATLERELQKEEQEKREWRLIALRKMGLMEETIQTVKDAVSTKVQS